MNFDTQACLESQIIDPEIEDRIGYNINIYSQKGGRKAVPKVVHLFLLVLFLN